MFFKGIRVLSPDRLQETIVFEKYPSGGAGKPAQGTGCAAFSQQIRGSAVFVVPRGKERQVAPLHQHLSTPLTPGGLQSTLLLSGSRTGDTLRDRTRLVPAVGAVGSRSPCFVPLPPPVYKINAYAGFFPCDIQKSLI